MVKGYVTLIEKMKDGTRLIDLAVTLAMQGYRRHFPKTKSEDMIGYLNPKMYTELEMEGRNFGIDIIPKEGIPFHELWVCTKEAGDVRSQTDPTV